MKLIVGLGNPGKEYTNTRHNIGFLVIDKIAKNENFSEWRHEKKFQAQISRGAIVAEDAILAKPDTFMNNSGEAVLAISQYYKILPPDIIVIHDDLDLPLTKIRISHNSSSGGHQGVQSIIDRAGTQEFTRIRLGIAGEGKENFSAEEYVLKNFSSEEFSKIESSASLIIEAVESVITLGVGEAMNEFN